MEVRRLDPTTGGLVTILKGIENRVAEQATRPAGDIVIRQTLSTVDPNTGVSAVFGQLPDGTVGFQQFLGDTEPPPVPVTPSVSSAMGTATVIWAGSFAASATAPADFDHCNVYGQKVGSPGIVLGGTVINPNDSVIFTSLLGGDSWSFWLTSVDKNGNESAASAATTPITIASVLDDTGLSQKLHDNQVAIDAANLAISKKNSIFSGTTAPTGTFVVGDIWYNTAEGNKPYRWDGTAWANTEDQAVITAQSTAVSAQNTAAAANTTAATAQSVAVSAQNTAISANNLAISAQNTAVSAQSAAVSAQNTAVSANNAAITAQSTAVSANNVAASAQGTAVSAQSAAASAQTVAAAANTLATTANNTANSAQVIANGKNHIFLTSTTPTASADGDMWVDLGNGRVLKSWSASATAWVPAIQNGAITATQIAADTIVAGNIAAGAVTASELAANSVSASALAANSITATALAAGSITATALAAGSITATALAAQSITATALAAQSVTASALAAGSITASALAAQSITATALAAQSITATALAAQSITATAMAANSISATALQAGSVVASTLAAQSVLASAIATNTITANQIAASTITGDRISASTITSTQIAASTIQANNIAASAIRGDHINAGAIDGMVITGAIVRTAPSGARIVLDQTSLNAWNTAGDNYFNMSSDTGVNIASLGKAGYDITRVNYCTNPSMEVDISGWTSAQTVVRDTTQFDSGTASLKATTTGASGDRVVSRIETLLVNGDYTAIAKVRYSSASYKATRIQWDWLDTNNTVLGSYLGQAALTPANTWGAVVVATSAGTPTGAVKYRISVIGTGLATADAMWVDSILVENAYNRTTDVPFDGSTATSGSYSYAWRGTTGLSASEERKARDVKIKTGGIDVIGPLGATQQPGVGFYLPTPYAQTAGLFSDGNVISLVEGGPGPDSTHIDVGNSSIYTWSASQTTIRSKGAISITSDLSSVLLAGDVQVSGKFTQPIRTLTTVPINSGPPTATLWGPGIMTVDTTRSFNYGFASFPANDTITVNEAGTYAIHFIFYIGDSNQTYRPHATLIEQGTNTLIAAGEKPVSTDAIGHFTLSVSNWYFAAGRQFKVNFQQNSGSTKTWSTTMIMTKLQ